MLDVLSYPVSFLLRLWHLGFGVLFGTSNVVGWILAIAFLVFTLRALLLRPAIGQARFLQRMRELSPQLTKLRERHGGDKDRYAKELQKLLGEHQVNPLRGYLPMLVQLPVFVGLGHVMRALTSVPVGDTYAFGTAEVGSFLDAKLFGVHLGDTLLRLATFQVSLPVAAVAVPLALLAAAATYLTARVSATGDTESALARVVRYLPPVAVLFAGAVLPVGLLVYWVSNNLWTLGQQYVLVGRGKPARAADRR